jgi:hypothetical protein
VVSTRDRVTLFRTPTRCIGPDGVLRIAVEREEKDSYLGIPDHPEIGLYARHGNFDWNFIKALLVILFQLALLSAVAVSGSTFLSAPVSVLFAFFVFFCGNLIDFMRNAASVLSWGTSSHSHTHGQEAGGVLAGLWQWIVDRISDMAGFAMPKVAQIMPNLQQFDVAGNVMSGDEIPFAMIVNAMVYFGAFGLFAVIVGQIVFRKKEIE